MFWTRSPCVETASVHLFVKYSNRLSSIEFPRFSLCECLKQNCQTSANFMTNDSVIIIIIIIIHNLMMSNNPYLHCTHWKSCWSAIRYSQSAHNVLYEIRHWEVRLFLVADKRTLTRVPWRWEARPSACGVAVFCWHPAHIVYYRHGFFYRFVRKACQNDKYLLMYVFDARINHK